MQQKTLEELVIIHLRLYKQNRTAPQDKNEIIREILDEESRPIRPPGGAKPLS